jgi:hypothetical protein
MQTEQQQPQSNTHDNNTPRMIRKIARINHFGIYWNPISATAKDAEHLILQHLPPEQIRPAMEGGIARRRRPTTTTYAPAHAYLLLPVDGTLQAAFATSTSTATTVQQQQQQTSDNTPAVQLTIQIPDVHFQVRDFQCLQMYRLLNYYKEYKYGTQYRHYRPTVTVMEDPRAWWQYAFHVIRFQCKEHCLRWSLGRFQRGLQKRRRYCDLYERKLRAAMQETATTGRLEHGTAPLNEQERKELEAMEDGSTGDLSIEDIILYRILVDKRVGIQAQELQRQQQTSWLRRTVHNLIKDDDEAELDYQRLLSYWQDLSRQDVDEASVEASKSLVSLSIELSVNKGKLSFFSPLPATADLMEMNRLQQHFLAFNYERYKLGFSLMRDFKSLAVNLSLLDFVATEVRSDRLEHVVVARVWEEAAVFPQTKDQDFARAQQPDKPCLFSFLMTRNPPSDNDFDTGKRRSCYF